MSLPENFLSVLIPAYNAEKFIPKLLDSILSQTNFDLKNLHVIVRNDGSTDNTLTILNEYKEKFSNIEIINDKNKGINYSRANLIDACKTKYFIFSDADDYFTENAFSSFEKTTSDWTIDFDLLISKSKNLRQDGKMHNMFINDKLKGVKSGLSYIEFNVPFLWNHIFKTSILKQVDLYSFYGHNMWEDLLYSHIIFPYLKKVLICRNVTYIYVHHGNNETSLLKQLKFNPIIIEKINQYFELVYEKKYLDKLDIDTKKRTINNFVFNIYMILYSVNYIYPRLLKLKPQKKEFLQYKKEITDIFSKYSLKLKPPKKSWWKKMLYWFVMKWKIK